MNRIIVPKQRKFNDTEDIPLPMIKCSFCGNMTVTGLHQTRLKIIKKGEMRIINGKNMYKPPIAKQIDFYMCTNCVAKGTKWPGARP